MRKLSVFLLSVLLFSVGIYVFAQEDIKKHHEEALGITVEYPSKLWLLLLDKKTMSPSFIKDFMIVKKKEGGNYLSFHLITLRNEKSFFLEAKHYRDRVQKDRFPHHSAGILDRATFANENQKYGCDEGRIMGYEFQPKQGNKNTIYFYFLRKGIKMFVIETSYIFDKNEVNAANDLADMKKIMDSVKLD